MSFGLTSNTIQKIHSVLRKHPKINKVIIYGSRAKGNFKEGSDIDLTVIGDEMNYKDLIKVDNDLDDLLLPYSIDLSLFYMIENTDLINHIERIGQVFYEK